MSLSPIKPVSHDYCIMSMSLTLYLAVMESGGNLMILSLWDHCTCAPMLYGCLRSHSRPMSSSMAESWCSGAWISHWLEQKMIPNLINNMSSPDCKSSSWSLHPDPVIEEPIVWNLRAHHYLFALLDGHERIGWQSFNFYHSRMIAPYHYVTDESWTGEVWCETWDGSEAGTPGTATQ